MKTATAKLLREAKLLQNDNNYSFELRSGSPVFTSSGLALPQRRNVSNILQVYPLSSMAIFSIINNRSYSLRNNLITNFNNIY